MTSLLYSEGFIYKMLLFFLKLFPLLEITSLINDIHKGSIYNCFLEDI